MEEVRAWSAAETRKLITLWSDASIQAKLESSYRNKPIYERIAEDMRKEGYDRNWLQCQRKMKHLKTSYKKAKDANNRSGNGRTTCPFYDELDLVLGDRPTTQPLTAFDSATPEDEDEDLEEPTVDSSATESFDSTTTEDTTSEPGITTTDSSSTKAGPQIAPRETVGRFKGKRKRTRMEATVDVLTKTMTAQFEQEAKLQLQMQAAQHEHELRLFNVFVNAFATSQPSSTHIAPQHNTPPFYSGPHFHHSSVPHFPFPQSHFVPPSINEMIALPPSQVNHTDEQNRLDEMHYNL
nr:uncharacterized protein LOC129415094 [Misgurnus anguillicaudatus]